MHQHVPLELGVVKEPLSAALVSALKQLVAVDSVVLLQGGAVVEDLAAAFERTLEDLWLRVGGTTGAAATRSAAQDARAGTPQAQAVLAGVIGITRHTLSLLDTNSFTLTS